MDKFLQKKRENFEITVPKDFKSDVNMSYYNQYQLPSKTYETKEDNYDDEVNLLIKSISINSIF